MPKKPEREPDLSPAAARASALRILARREHSAEQLRRKLAQRGFEPETCREVVAELAEARLQSEDRFAENLVVSRLRQGYGPLRIRAELRQARVDDIEASAALSDAEADFRALAAQARERRFGPQPESADDWGKQYRFLATRGFEPEQILAALKGEPPE